MLSRIYLRLLAIFLWLLLSIGSYKGWVILASLKPNDQPFWESFAYEFYIASFWPYFTILVVGITLIYIIELIYNRPESLRYILFWVAGMGLAAIAIYPIGSYDIFGNVAFAHLHAHYGLNPYQTSVADINNYLSDPFLKNMWWLSHGSPYGPLWTWLSYGIYHAAAAFGFITLVFGFKFIGLLMHLMITYVIYILAEYVTTGRGAQAAIIYGMNPLAIFEIVASGHNDGPAILLLLLVLYFLIQKRYLTGLAIASIATTFKLTVVFAIPFIIWKTAKERGQLYTLLGLGLMGTLIIISYQPLWVGLDTLVGVRITTGGYISNSLPTLFYAFGYKNLIHLVHMFGLIVFSLCYIALLWRIKSGNNKNLIISIGLGFVGYYLLGAGVIHNWYYLWPLAVMSTLPCNLLTKAVIGQTILLLPSYGIFLALGEGGLSNAYTYLLACFPLITLGLLHFKKWTISKIS